MQLEGGISSDGATPSLQNFDNSRINYYTDKPDKINDEAIETPLLSPEETLKTDEPDKINDEGVETLPLEETLKIDKQGKINDEGVETPGLSLVETLKTRTALCMLFWSMAYGLGLNSFLFFLPSFVESIGLPKEVGAL